MADTKIAKQAIDITLIPKVDFDRVLAADLSLFEGLVLLADMCRANTLSMVKRAGSGHLGSSLSAMDIVAWLYFHEMNIAELGVDHPDRDIYFSSKGHDVPGLYSVLYAIGVLPKDKILKLRRFEGLDGHPDRAIAGIEVNSGSLGMGISKGKGIALAKTLKGCGGRVFVLSGDGELQEGQNYEALQSAAHMGIDNLIVIVDHNKVQSDKPVEKIVSIGDLEQKFAAFGWHVARCDGHDFSQLAAAFDGFKSVQGPKILIADTLKGRGVSFMEHPYALAHNGGLYPWHAGAPDDEAYVAAHREIRLRLADATRAAGLAPLSYEDIAPESSSPSGVTREYVAATYGEALVALAKDHPEIVVLDADLAVDCRVRAFEESFPDRFIECGIAEQDMVSTAGGLANQGLLPVVNSFASFLASRANEQIYNNATEETRIIYACHYAGLIPAGPGKSHQSLRDISLFGALPNIEVIQPCNSDETRMAVDYCVKTSVENCVLRMNIGPSPRLTQLPDDYAFVRGQGVPLTDGTDALMFAYGPVMLNEAFLASELLADRGFGLQVVNMPWLNRVDENWLATTVDSYQYVYVLEDHSPVGGLGDSLLKALNRAGILAGLRFTILGVEGYPVCGTPPVVLAAHRLDGGSLADRIMAMQQAN